LQTLSEDLIKTHHFQKKVSFSESQTSFSAKKVIKNLKKN